MTIEAHVVLDSVSPAGHRLTTFRLRYPRFVHAELMTHRTFSRNSSSSRAVPVAKRIAEVRDPLTRATPVHWGRDQGGMQAEAELDKVATERAKIWWNDAAEAAAAFAEIGRVFGLHKQLVNRILEPFTHIDVVCTATEYMNFFGLRLDRAAQPEIRALAEAMWSAYGESGPVPIGPGTWHLPFVGYGNSADGVAFDTSVEAPEDVEIWKAAQRDGIGASDVARKVSVARCARVSYQSHATGRRSTVEEDLKLYERLLTGRHWSPFEHAATPDEKHDLVSTKPGVWTNVWQHPHEQKNYTGWRQFRATMAGETMAPLPEGYR